MCNLYTSRLSRDEVRSHFRRRELIDKDYFDVVQVYPAPKVSPNPAE